MRIAIATTTRADWGLLSPLAKELVNTNNVDLKIIAGNMHFLPESGMTYREIEQDGFEIAKKIASGMQDQAAIMAETLRTTAEALDSINPDILIILGDRYEMLAVASAAALRRVPIVHIAGGAISEGAFDDAFRHAITKLSSLHLTETEKYRKRVIQMGEHPDTVVCTGAIGVYNALNVTPMSCENLEKSLNGFKVDKQTLLVTLHPATLDTLSPEQQMQQMLDALDSFPQYRLLITHPNNDTDPHPLIEMLNKYRDNNTDRVCIVPSLGRVRYLSALHYVWAVVGNSSSGIVEVPSMQIPTLDIGIRQRGRIISDSVIRCNADTKSIIDGLRVILSTSMAELASYSVNPYYKPNTPKLMVDAIMNFDWTKAHTKQFWDI